MRGQAPIRGDSQIRLVTFKLGLTPGEAAALEDKVF